MSFIITIRTREGIVMASDSRLTLNSQQQNQEGANIILAAGMSDSNYKTFLAFDKIGVSTFGKADINGAPIGGYIKSFIREQEALEVQPNVTNFAASLNEFFREFDPIPDSGFHITGYEATEAGPRQKVFRVAPFHNYVNLINPENENGETQGATWDGESDIMMRLIQPLFIQDNNGAYQAIPNFPIPWQFFTLQDAIDFSVYAIRTTIDSVRFQPRAKTVGGPIDVLVITEDEAKWIKRKELKSN